MRSRTIAVLLGCLLSTLSVAEEWRLHIAWPESWEMRAPETRGSALRLQARQRKQEKTTQLLDLTAVNVSAGSGSVDTASVRILVERLRDATLPTAVERNIELIPLESSRGFYFVATDQRYRSGARNAYRQLVEGVMLQSGYLISFTLLTNDARGLDATEILRVLDGLTVD